MTNQSAPGSAQWPQVPQAPYGVQAPQGFYGGQYPYGPQPGNGPQQAGQFPYGQPPFPGFPRRRRSRRRAIWLSVGAVAVIFIAVVAVGAVLASGGNSGNSGMLSATACGSPGQPASSSGPWKVVVPHTLCGEPFDNTGGAGQGDLAETELIFSMPGIYASPGHYTSALNGDWETPGGLGIFRGINFVGFSGTFNTSVGVGDLVQVDSGSFSKVPPGPHGGIMECAREQYGDIECVFGTPTTLGDFQFQDTAGVLTKADAWPGNAILIRDALEVPG